MPRTYKQTYSQKRAKKKEESLKKAEKLKANELEYRRTPKSFVIRRGRIGKIARDLVKDTRYLMLPNTAINLRERASNTVNELKMAGLEMCVSHFLVYSSASTGLHLRIAKLPRGPTCLFKVEEYSLKKDLQAANNLTLSQTSYVMRHPPLLILNGFNKGGEEMKTVRTVLQMMFPPIQASVARLHQFRRAMLFSYDEKTGLIDLRHYLIKTRQAHEKQRKEEEEEEDEDIPEDKVVLPINEDGKENIMKKKTLVKLVEIGPRMTLKLLSILSDFLRGRIVYRLYDYDDDEKWMKDNAEVFQQAKQEYVENKEKRKEKEKKKRMDMEKDKQRMEEDSENDEDDVFYDDEELMKMEEDN
ncbi:hypothetical protein EIN_086400 [Entamoeba invadens IP1]|uniref:hypothetical protein n=1 Tax=Entamoeba invadens IP1 TaxID=370355 RepID=UPI0002C3F01C|nr:hypothetical protein EIN_086400 [Entamoeba invadens IP1]ELP85368.1 hypothetical protein EIN_086400 [Entamoeba invadens IP1]|eukprot:XP_004184714.1 hypothetical protein EIN_086400 [Entamoeba invadens IP1]